MYKKQDQKRKKEDILLFNGITFFYIADRCAWYQPNSISSNKEATKSSKVYNIR